MIRFPVSSSSSRLHLSRLALSFAIVLGACSDDQSEPSAPSGQSDLPSAVLAVLTCTGSASSITCDDALATSAASAAVSASGPRFDRVLGGQNTYVRLEAVSNSFASATNRLTSVVSVKNLTTQPLGTTQGTAYDANRVRVFFHSPPTNGVTIVNPDGTGNFTASGQPFYKYNEIIYANATNTIAKSWIFQLPSASTTFTFQVYVTGKQPDEAEGVELPPHTFASFARGSGDSHACALRSGGIAYCWGSPEHGKLGNGDVSRGWTEPVGVNDTSHYNSLAIGYGSSCGVVTSGIVKCWGMNQYGQLGDSTGVSQPTPVSVKMPLGVTFMQVVAADVHACALANTGVVYCWGRNAFGQLGDGTLVDRYKPTPVQMPSGVTFTSIAAGVDHTCGLTSAGVAYCWGYNQFGQLGDNTQTHRTAPRAVIMPSGQSFTAISGGSVHTCAVAASGQAYCWGNNGNLQLGDNTSTYRPIPTAVWQPSLSFATITAGYGHSCALTAGGAAYCWGFNGSGQLGNGSLNNASSPVPVTMPSGMTFTSIYANKQATHAISTTGAGYSWGNGWGWSKIGDGANVQRNVPTAVRMP